MTNPITQQIRDTRHRLAMKFNNDLDRIVDDLLRQQAESGLSYIDRSSEKNQSMQRNGAGDVADHDESASELT